MKIFSQKTKPALISLVILVGLLGVGFGVVAQTNPLISNSFDFVDSSGLHTKHGRLVLSTNASTDVSDTNPSNSIDEPWLPELRLFSDDKISSFAGLFSNGKAYVTPASVGSQSYVTFGGSAIDTSETVVVDGNILATSLTNFSDFNAQNRLCVNPNGVVEICAAPAACGNGVVEPGEQCDDGNVVEDDGCSSVCWVETPHPICGNGIVESGEDCDDGNTSDGDLCSSECETNVDLVKMPSYYCYTGSGPAGAATAIPYIISDDTNNPSEVSSPSSDPDYNATFVKKWEWQKTDGILAESLTTTQSSYKSGLDDDMSFGDIKSSMVADSTYTDTGIQYEGTNSANLSPGSQSSLEFSENIYRVRGLDNGNSPVTGWTYINTLEPIAQAYDSSYSGSGYTGGVNLLTNTTSSPSNPNLQWANSYNDTTDRKFFNYVVQRKLSSSSTWTTLATYTPGNQETSYTDTSFSGLPSGTYQYRIRVENTCGGSVTQPSSSANTFSYSNVISVTK